MAADTGNLDPSAVYPNLIFVDLTGGPGKLIEELRIGEESNLSLRRILHLVTSSPPSSRAKAAVLETNYIDLDFAPAFSRFFARSLRDYPKRTTRLHFFSEPIVESDLMFDPRLDEKYMGYTILSPVEPLTAGRTIVPFRSADVSSLAFVIPHSSFAVNLNGASLHARGFPFYEQDDHVSACATAAIWMATSALASRSTDLKERFQSASPTEITELANKNTWGDIGRPLPASGGLTIEQILWALHELGFEGLTLYPGEKGDELDMADALYEYVESGIPPILILDLPNESAQHAVTLVGHTYDPGATLSSFDVARETISTRAWCPRFLMHDDQTGPYREIWLGKPRAHQHGLPSVNVFAGSAEAWEEERMQQFYKDAYLIAAVLPLPPRAYLLSREAQRKSWHVLLTAKEMLKKRGFDLELPNPPVARTHLVPSNEFKEYLHPDVEGIPDEVRVPGLSRRLAELYRGTLMAPTVWVTEFCRKEDRADKQPIDLRTRAEVILDPTSYRDSLDFVALHVQGLYLSMGPTDNDPREVFETREPELIKDDSPWRPLSRHH